MNLDSFITKYNGQSIPNNHGKYKGECVSLAARYAQEVQNVPDGDGTLYCQKTGGARDLYEHPTAIELQYYDLIPYGQPRQRGDLVVWGANLGQYGDIAIANDGGTVIFGQLGTPVFIPANIRSESRPPLGYLRRKGGNVEPTDYRMNDGDVINGFAIFKRTPSPEDLAVWTGQTFKKFQYEKLADGVAKMPPPNMKPYDGPQLYETV